MDLETQTRLRKAYIEFCKQMGTTHYLTLATHKHWTLARMKKLIGSYVARMDGFHLGTTWSREPLASRMNGMFFIEGDTLGAHTHAHGLIRFPYGNEWGRKLLTTHFWRELCPSGTSNVQTIWSEGAAGYSSKNMEWRNYDEDRLVLLADFMSDKSLSS